MDTRIYCISHKKFTKPDMPCYIPLQVGRTISKDLGYLGDDTGDSISEKNRNYCELTGIYWIWKNVKCDIVGICHYRRYFVKDEEFLTQEYIEETLTDRGYDLIVSRSGDTGYESIYEQYEQCHYAHDFDICREVLMNMYPDYLSAFDLAAESKFMTLGNMIITSKEIFDSYCEWLFPLLSAVEAATDISEYDAHQARIYGYLAERLLRVWILNNSYKVREEEVRMINPEEAHNASKLLDIKIRCVNLIFNDFLSICKTKFDSDLHSDRIEAFEEEQGFPKENFNGKIPVFTCWWQGIDNMPNMLRRCIESIDRNLPDDLVEFHLITLENVGNYITFPDWIVEKFNNNVITYTHLSDILRCALLNKYGGMWIDATYYMTDKFDRRIFLNDKNIVGYNEGDYLWTLCYEKSLWKVDVSAGRWSGNCIYTNKKNPLMRFMTNAFYEYWRTQDKLIDYFLIDILINLAYENILGVKEMIDSVKPSNPHALDLRDLLNKNYKHDVWNEITKDTSIFKLQRQISVRETNVVGDKTFYGKLIEC